MMKKILLTIVFVVPVFLMSNAQYTASVKPGFNLDGLSFGHRFSKLTPFIGFRYLGFSYDQSHESIHKYWDYDSTYYETRHYSTTKIKARVFIPYLGLKYQFLDQYPLQAFAIASFNKPFLSGSYDYTYDGNPEPDDEFIDAIRSTGVFGGEVGLGAEYFLNEHFSLAGEFGFRFAHFSYTYDYKDTDYGYEDYYAYTDQIDLKLNSTYTAISLNFYFDKKKKEKSE